VTHLRVDLTAKKVTTLDVLKTHLVNEWSHDGKYLVTTRVGDGDEWEPKGVYLMNPDGTEHRMLTDAAIHGRLSPTASGCSARTTMAGSSCWRSASRGR